MKTNWHTRISLIRDSSQFVLQSDMPLFGSWPASMRIWIDQSCKICATYKCRKGKSAMFSRRRCSQVNHSSCPILLSKTSLTPLQTSHTSTFRFPLGVVLCTILVKSFLQILHGYNVTAETNLEELYRSARHQNHPMKETYAFLHDWILSVLHGMECWFKRYIDKVESPILRMNSEIAHKLHVDYRRTLERMCEKLGWNWSENEVALGTTLMDFNFSARRGFREHRGVKQEGRDCPAPPAQSEPRFSGSRAKAYAKVAIHHPVFVIKQATRFITTGK